MHRPTIQLELHRFEANQGANALISLLFVDGVFQCFILENFEKSIPIGVWPVQIEPSLTPLTKRYLSSPNYPYFERHIEIIVPDRDGIYFHPANYAHQLEGCLAPGEEMTRNYGGGTPMVSSSRQAYAPFYKWLYPLLKDGYQAEIKITCSSLLR